MRKIGFSLTLLVALSVASASGASKDEERLANAAKALDEIMSAPDKGIPGDLLNKADCVVIIPGMKKGDLSLEAGMERAWLVVATKRKRIGGHRPCWRWEAAV